jgi:hypothetical protein
MFHEGQTLDFQSTALPTELPSLSKLRIPRVNHGARSLKQKTPNPQRPTPNSECFREQALNSKLTRQFNCPAQKAQVMVSRNFDTTKLSQMRGEPLRVKQREFSSAQMLYERDQ